MKSFHIREKCIQRKENSMHQFIYRLWILHETILHFRILWIKNALRSILQRRRVVKLCENPYKS